jgi:hypothetical protein
MATARQAHGLLSSAPPLRCPAAHHERFCRNCISRSGGLSAQRGPSAMRSASARRLPDQNQRPHQYRGPAIAITITSGQAHDVSSFPALMQEIDCDPEQTLGDNATTAKLSPSTSSRGGRATLPPQRPRKYGTPLIRLSMPCAIASSTSSTERRTPAASPPAMTS